jgi:beta-galactosidase
VDDEEILGDGSDATRVWFKTVDRFGAWRPFAGGEVTFEIMGPGVIVGDNPFQLAGSGGVGAVWIKSQPAMHSSFGAKSVSVKVSHI